MFDKISLSKFAINTIRPDSGGTSWCCRGRQGRKEKHMAKRPRLTTTSGMPVADNQNAITAGPRGPVLMQDFHLLEKLAHQNRERIPERTVHAKGSGAYGTLTVTHDVTRYTKAKVLLQVGKKTEAFLRFSTVAGERGSADAG